MRIQTEPIYDHNNHSLDAMVEYGELDCGAYLAIILYADRGEIDDIFHEDQDNGWRSRVATRFTNLGDLLISKLPVEQQGYLAHTAFGHGIRTLKNMAPILADWALVDQCEGGSLTPFKRNYRHLNDYRIPNRARRKLYSRKWIKRYVRHNKEVWSLHPLFNRIFDRMFAIPREYVVDGSDWIQKSMAWQLEHTPIQRASRGIIDKDRRRVLRKSLRTAQSIVPAPTLAAFIRREEVSVKGQNLILKVKRTRSLVSEGHGVFAVSVCDLEEVLLATLCIYFEDTPALDQLIGMILYVSSGCEEEFVRAANVIHLTDAGKKHPLLMDKKYHDLDDIIDRVHHIRKKKGVLLSLPYAALKERRDSYWKDTGPIWIDQLSSFVLGPKASKLMVDMYT